MSRTAKIVLCASLAIVALLAGGVLYVWKRPLTVFRALGRRALVKAGFEKKTLETRAGKQTFFRGGAGPVLVLIHGAGDQAGTFANVAPALAKRFTVLIPDLAGHGESAPPEGPISLGMVLDGLDTVLVKEAGSIPVTIAGNSMGAWVAILYAKKNPAHVKHLVLIDGGPLQGDPTDLTLLPKDREEARKVVAALRDPASPPIPGFVLDDIVRTARTGPIARLFAAKDLPSFLLDGQLGTIETPVDLVWGESDGLVPVTYANRMLSQLPNARLTTLRACGHAPQQECPAQLLSALEKALAAPPGATTSRPPPA